MKILFINGSPEHNGNTAHLAQAMLGGREYETVELGDLKGWMESALQFWLNHR